MKQKVDGTSNVDSNNSQVQKQKERRIVSWSQEEDDVLREQIRVNGTENWTIIASKFKDKTTRQCRRRWFTYLNSDFKKGGWSSEEDKLLCEAQKMYGNRWTEIAKMVPGRTDNAVKNRFTTLCKKKAKREALAKENSTKSYINLNNKRVLSRNGFNADGSTKSDEPVKRLRTCILTEQVKLAGKCGAEDCLHGLPFSLAAQSIHSCEVNFPMQPLVEASSDGSTNNKCGRTFLEKDDPEVLALVEQADLLDSPAVKVNSDKMDQSLDNVSMVLEDYLKQNDKSDLHMVSNSGTNFHLAKSKEELVEDLGGCNEGNRSSLREPDVYESSSPTNSNYSTESTQLSNTLVDKTEEYEAEISMLHQETGFEHQMDQLEPQHCPADVYGIGYGTSMNDQVSNVIASDMKVDEGAVCEYSYTEFSSPLLVTPLFRALAATIPSPQFSESEKHFLMKTLGMESPSTCPIANAAHPPTCKRSLLHCL